MKKNILFAKVLLLFFFVINLLGCPSQTENVQEVSLESIYISKKPNKTNYEINSQLDLTGLEIKARYSDGTEKKINGWTSNLKTGDVLSTAGTIKITITYEEKTASFTITVAQKSLSSIYISKQANKLKYEYGALLDLAGL